jgi:Dehydrogenases with different specificities (related to short-chain alcohol dehydrogenases)
MSSNFKKAIIIGGSKGIGQQISQNIKSLGIKTYSCSRNEIDTSDLASVKKFVLKHKSTDILVLNSGGPPPLKLSKISINDWKKYFNQLFLSFFILLQKIKINKNGYIFYISSSIIKEPGDELIISSSLRPAMSSLLKSVSISNSKKNISTINIAPGPFKTRRIKELVKDIKKMEKSLPTGKIGDPKEIGLFVKFVIKNKIKYISGSTVYFDGNINKSYL